MSENNELNLNVTKELSKDIADATDAESIRAALHVEVDKQIPRDSEGRFTPMRTRARETAEAEPTAYTRTETINGRTFTFENESELELERMVNNAYKVANSLAEYVPAAEPTGTASQAAARAAQDLLDKSDLELQFKRGTISADEYLAKSGAVAHYLESQGVPLAELKATVEENQSRAFEGSWADATAAFLQSAAGRDWPGGDKNLELIGLKIQSLNLVDAEDKVAALAQAYASMRQTGVIFPYEPAEHAELTQQRTETGPGARTASTVAATERPAARPQGRTSSSMFGQSSGVGGESRATAPSRMDTRYDIPANASPAEILAAWKADVIARGADPNAEFSQSFATKR